MITAQIRNADKKCFATIDPPIPATQTPPSGVTFVDTENLSVIGKYYNSVTGQFQDTAP